MGRRLARTPTFVIGAVLLLRWEALREVGMFDERFFLYAEETDWQRRAAGSRVDLERVLERHGPTRWSRNELRSTIVASCCSTPPTRRTSANGTGQPGGWLPRGSVPRGGRRAIVLRDQRRAEAARRARVYLRGPRRSVALARN